MQSGATQATSRLEQRLAGLGEHPVLGDPSRFYLRRREQLLYLVVGGWNTVFGYAVWALLQLLLGELPALSGRRRASRGRSRC